MTDIRTQPFHTENGLTIKELKEILSHLPDQDEYGQDYEIWVGNNGDFTSNVVKWVWSLNKSENGCDVILEY